MRTKWIYERPDWPRLTWNSAGIAAPLADVRHHQGRLLGRMRSLGAAHREEAALLTLTDDVLKTSEIEGESLDRGQVRSSIARRLGMDAAGAPPRDRNVEGIVEILIDATRRYSEPLSEERLFAWQAALFPTGRSGLRRIKVGTWRGPESDPMTVVSGALAAETVHFEAPKAARVAAEMHSFIDWCEASSDIDAVLRAAVAHFWFVTIHPFDDGNGRIARAISDMMLARSENSPQRFYSMSAQIRLERASYYDVLEHTQKGPLDITPWVEWFLACLGRAIDGAESALSGVLAKAKFWERHRDTRLNDRQRRVLNRILDGFEGKLTSSKYAKLAKCSQDTASRDLKALVEAGMLARGAAGGRSTSFEIVRV